MTLREYVRKRRFGATPEPTDDSVAAPSRRPIFVVQLHHASSRHYDFRLEADGVLKSWAVPKGPSLRVGEKRLAVQVEDHPLSYAGFAGDIPEGHYGAGHVDVFDHGTWSCDGEPLAAIAAGKLDFVLHGERLNGNWKLVRTALRGKQPQWLLIKRDDAFAADREADDLLQDAPAAAPKRAAKATKASKAKPTRGQAPAATAATPAARPRRSDAAWRKRALALDGAHDRPCPPGERAQLTTLRERAPDGAQWLHEIKWDGYRLLADLDAGQATLRSRNDQAWTETFAEVAHAVQALPVNEARLDGELVVLDADGRSDFSALQRVIDGSSKQPLRYLVFDLLGVAGVDLRDMPLLQRKHLLRALLGDAPGVLAYSDHVLGHGSEVFAAAAAKGYEGVVSKRADARHHGGRGGDWVKTKHENSDDFAIVGYTDPKGARNGFGSLLLAQRSADGLRYVGRVGTGFDESGLRRLLAQLQALHSEQAAVDLPAHAPFPRRSVHWVRPQLVAEVAFRGWAKEGLLRQAAFKRLREDKPLQDLGGDRALPPAAAKGSHAVAARAAASAKKTAPAARGSATLAKRSASNGAAAKSGAARRKPATAKPVPRASAAARKAASSASTDAAAAAVVLTHPERVVYPGAGISKGEVADYYRAIARWLLQEVAGRPLSLLRCPEGAGGECFFQKHNNRALGQHVQAIALKQKSGTEDYLYIDDLAGLLELVQMNTLELHPWGSTVDDPEHPDRLVFDLDPGEGVSWAQIKAAAREIRTRLRETGLESFVRLSGGKGLHVVVPIVPAADWEQARDFCEAFAQALTASAPERYVATMSKAKRSGVIFVDWLRNGRGNTSVCSWSLRARTHAAVAVPLRWEELARIASSQAFPLAKALQRAARLREHPWKEMATLEQRLPGS
ncbi:DNA ligase D [Xanthomonas cerealis pv. cerealis]|uniref:DNA ligase (ATP) n=1 Tax=Xanthomonas cerealis pv. cerealis TaxID=152263 RepID=A0A514EGS3_9XANT|nr:DNA ligase D [Xanthomonas translucens]QDI05184.1 DNA ligase D [Xanthomonas translucens pv. cerealis]